MQRSDLDRLDPGRVHWVPAVVAPHRDGAGAPGCRRGARFVVDLETLRPARGGGSGTFESRAECLRWIMVHRAELARTAPDAAVVPVDLAQWMLGMA